ncbi:MAG: choice-of-anchor B family protein [Balneolaceae bacterium]
MFRYLIIPFTLSIFYAACSSSTEPAEIVEEPDFTECVNGMADGFPCNNIGLYGVISNIELLSERADNVGPNANDIWGWTDPETNREYALVGLTDGVTAVDVTDPANPVVMAKFQEPEDARSPASPLIAFHDDGSGIKDASAWRDLKVFQNHLYVVSEQGNHGMQIFDLTRLRNITSPPAMLQQDAQYNRFGNAHNIAINEETGFAYVVGSTTGEICASQGALHMIDLADPLSPQYAGCAVEPEAGGITRAGYIHDTQCVIYGGPDTQFAGRELCFSSAERTFLITDVTDKQNPVTIFNSSYPGNAYAHQGWLTEDHRFFMMNDELDEQQANINTRTYVWDLASLTEAAMIGFYQHSTIAIDHNVYIRGDRMYQANYTAGLRLLDVSNPLPGQITEIGFFNTTPTNSRREFAGTWSVYPWFNSNTVVLSDINQGLFILHVER